MADAFVTKFLAGSLDSCDGCVKSLRHVVKQAPKKKNIEKCNIHNVDVPINAPTSRCSLSHESSISRLVLVFGILSNRMSLIPFSI